MAFFAAQAEPIASAASTASAGGMSVNSGTMAIGILASCAAVAAGAIAGTADGRAEQSTYPMHAVLFVGGTKLSLINRLPAPVHSAEQR